MQDKKFRRSKDQESICAYCPGNQVCLCKNYKLESKTGKLNDEWLCNLAECDPKLLINEYDSTTETDQASQNSDRQHTPLTSILNNVPVPISMTIPEPQIREKSEF